MRRGKFIVIEGVDGSGKSTLVRGIVGAMADSDPLQLAFPSCGSVGNLARSIMCSSESVPESHALPYLFAADFVAALNESIIPALDVGRDVICDRYTLSTMVYQGGSDLVRRLVGDLLVPDLTIVVDVPAGIAMDRIRQRGVPDRHETLGRIQHLRGMYLSGVSGYSIVIDGTGDPETVLNHALDLIR